MKDHLISMYIDEELDLEEKIVFVETVHEDRGFKDAAVDLLNQERLLRAEVVERVPAVEIPEGGGLFRLRRFKPIAALAAGLGLAAAVFLFTINGPPKEPPLQAHRFVIYRPEAKRVEITGSFTGWRNVPLAPTAGGGYWEITLDIPAGEHRFSYVLEGGQRMTDPTIAVREADDFGGENSILALKL
jgi:hypothetical protein